MGSNMFHRDHNILPDHMVSFSKASSCVLESSARAREVWV